MSTDPHAALLIRETTVQDVRVLTMSGLLDSSTYRTARDRMIKAALDEPRAVVVDVTDLAVPAESAWAVFTSARWHLTSWPEVSLSLVCGHTAGRHALARNGILRYLPVYGTVPDATAAAAHGMMAPRRRVRREFPADPLGVGMARRFVVESLVAWELEDFAAAAAVVATALVDNVVRHTDSAPEVRLESSATSVTVAVRDTCTTLPARQEKAGAEPRLTGIAVVAAVCRVWGAAPLPDGKVVWAVIGPENRL